MNYSPKNYFGAEDLDAYTTPLRLINRAKQTQLANEPDISSWELLQIEKFVEENGYTIKYENRLYKVSIDSRAYLEPKCYELGEEIKNYPTLKRLIEMAEK
jgi:hypothetical protein